jgi:hypothetical protein
MRIASRHLLEVKLQKSSSPHFSFNFVYAFCGFAGSCGVRYHSLGVQHFSFYLIAPPRPPSAWHSSSSLASNTILTIKMVLMAWMGNRQLRGKTGGETPPARPAAGRRSYLKKLPTVFSAAGAEGD